MLKEAVRLIIKHNNDFNTMNKKKKNNKIELYFFCPLVKSVIIGSWITD